MKVLPRIISANFHVMLTSKHWRLRITSMLLLFYFIIFMPISFKNVLIILRKWNSVLEYSLLQSQLQAGLQVHASLSYR